MVEVPKDEPKRPESAPAVIMSSPQKKADDIVVEHDDAEPGDAGVRKPKDDPLAEMRRNMEDAQRASEEANRRASVAERERDAARTQIDAVKTNLVKSESEKVQAQEAAILNRVESAKSALVNAKNAWIEAMDTGKPASIQADLQEKIAEATYALKGAEGAKAHFDNWKEREKNKPASRVDDSITPAAKAWIDSHPRFNTDKKYKRTAVAAHEDALEDGVAADSPEYFRRIDAALKEAGLEGDDDGVTAHNPVKKNSSGTSTAAPASHNSTEAGARGGNAAEESRTGRRVFKLDANMREQAIKQFGKGSNYATLHKISPTNEEAYKIYAERQLKMAEIKKNGGDYGKSSNYNE